MPLFRLSHRNEFPPARLARVDGLLCIGGDLSQSRILLAYRNGIFPWYSSSEPILWWSPDPRLVLYPEKIRVSRSLKKKIRKHHFQITMDRNFDGVIRECADSRIEKREETWLGRKMIQAYTRLHKSGYAHSVEAWKDGTLAGGLYGISLGGCFFGESMFTRVSDASKTALCALACHLETLGFNLIDCQVTTDHMLSMGAEEIPRADFLSQIETSLARKTEKGPWEFNQKGFVEKFSTPGQ
ncbi:MAG TPA: leucyl/phenylalanyl-tRNA--protein transferase [Desulfobacteraceae bacterium]|nr:leucyl/phenylalanyl-tRNA--protein transferase [Desulfobacteraceae bacterium]